MYPGGADPHYAKVDLEELDDIPELIDKYPEFSMFKELPAWGFYIRHVKGLSFENVTLCCQKEDFRKPIVLDDVHGAQFKNLVIKETGKDEVKRLEKEEHIYLHNATGVKIE